KAYHANLEANLKSLLDRIKSGRYKAPPVHRAYIPKADGTRRPLGIPTFKRQSGATSNRHGAGGRLRTGLSALFIRLPARAVGAQGATPTLRRRRPRGLPLRPASPGSLRFHTWLRRYRSLIAAPGHPSPPGGAYLKG